MTSGRATLRDVAQPEKKKKKGPAFTSAAELAMREKIVAVYRKARKDAQLTQQDLGLRLEPDANNPNARVSRFERCVGDFSIYGCIQLAHAISPTFTLAQALVDAKVERATFDRQPDNTLLAIEADPMLTPANRRAAVVLIRQMYSDRQLELDSTLHRTQRRDEARRADIPEEMLSAWSRLTPEQREQIASTAVEQAQENAETPAPRRKRSGRRGSAGEA